MYAADNSVRQCAQVHGFFMIIASAAATAADVAIVPANILLVAQDVLQENAQQQAALRKA
jgi:hypothetical protein